MKPLKNSENNAAAEIAAELFAGLGDIVIKRMFGGAGIYCDDLFFALIFEGEIYIKTDAAFSKELAKQGSKQFIYIPAKTKKPLKIHYWRLPESALENTSKAEELGKRSLKIARAKEKKI